MIIFTNESERRRCSERNSSYTASSKTRSIRVSTQSSFYGTRDENIAGDDTMRLRTRRDGRRDNTASNRPDVPAHGFVNVSRYGPERRKPVISEFAMPLWTLGTLSIERNATPNSPKSSIFPLCFSIHVLTPYYALLSIGSRQRIDREPIVRNPINPGFQ